MAFDYMDQPQVIKYTDRAPVASFTTPWIRSNGSLFRVDLTVVGPVPEESKRYLALSRCQAENIRQAISDLVKLLKEELR